MNRELLTKLDTHYAKENLNLLKALRVWREARLSAEDIRMQIAADVGVKVNGVEARELQHLGASMEHDYTSFAQRFEITEGRSDLIPENIKEDKIKLIPAIKQSMEKVGQNLYRDKKAGTYWTLKEKLGDNGEKAVYLVAVDEPEDTQKIAEED